MVIRKIQVRTGFADKSINEMWLLVLCAFAAVAFMSCSKSSVVGPSNEVSFSGQIQPLFTTNCALSGCHAGAEPQDGMSLEPGKAYANIVNQPNIEFGNYLIVKPFYPDSSYLYFKITGNPIAGPRMPYGKAPLDSSDIQTIKDWIDQGAKNN